MAIKNELIEMTLRDLSVTSAGMTGIAQLLVDNNGESKPKYPISDYQKACLTYAMVALASHLGRVSETLDEQLERIILHA